MHDFLKAIGILMIAVGVLAAITAFTSLPRIGDGPILTMIAIGGIGGGMSAVTFGLILEYLLAIKDLQERQAHIIERLYATTAAGKSEAGDRQEG